MRNPKALKNNIGNYLGSYSTSQQLHLSRAFSHHPPELRESLAAMLLVLKAGPTIGALIIRIGFWGILYYNYNYSYDLGFLC